MHTHVHARAQRQANRERVAGVMAAWRDEARKQRASREVMVTVGVFLTLAQTHTRTRTRIPFIDPCTTRFAFALVLERCRAVRRACLHVDVRERAGVALRVQVREARLGGQGRLLCWPT